MNVLRKHVAQRDRGGRRRVNRPWRRVRSLAEDLGKASMHIMDSPSVDEQGSYSISWARVGNVVDVLVDAHQLQGYVDSVETKTSPSVGADPAVEGTGLAVVEPMDGDDSAVAGTAPSGASRAEGVGAAGASAAPTPACRSVRPNRPDLVIRSVAVYAERDPETGFPGIVMRCVPCDQTMWHPKTKHGLTMLKEAIESHTAHTRVSR